MAQGTIALDPAVSAPVETRRPTAGFWADVLWRLRHDPTTIAALAVFVLMIILALGADLLADNFFHWSFAKQDLLNTYAKPTLNDPAMWLGADHIGRSVVVRLLYGARVSLFIGVFGMLVTLSIGLPQTRYPTPAQKADFWEHALAALHTVPGVDTLGATSRSPSRKRCRNAKSTPKHITPSDRTPNQWIVTSRTEKTACAASRRRGWRTDSDHAKPAAKSSHGP